MQNSERNYEVVIVGAGPVGLIAANLLGQYNIKTLVLEKEESPYSYPRAIGIDDEALRVLQYLGFELSALNEMCEKPKIEYFSPNGYRSFAPDPNNKIFGFPLLSTFLQYELELKLRKNLENYKNVTFEVNKNFLKYQDRSNNIVIDFESEHHIEQVSTQYLLASDGGKSTIRKQANIAWLGQDQPEKWLVVDVHDNKEILAKISDESKFPLRDDVIVTINLPKNLRRFEIKIPERNISENLDNPDTAGLLDRFLSETKCVVIRSRVYGRHYRIAEKFRKDRVFLLGDAAHLIPPYGGQGLCSGIRDALNLCWKISLRLKLDSKVDLLETYQKERYFHMCQTINFVRSLSSNVEKYDKHEPSQITTEEYRNLKLIPYFESGFFTKTPYAGEMLPQPLVIDQEGRKILLDDKLGKYFTILAINLDIDEILFSENIMLNNFWFKTLSLYTTKQLGLSKENKVSLAEKNLFFEGGWFDVIILRPDRFIYSTCFVGTLKEELYNLFKLINLEK